MPIPVAPMPDAHTAWRLALADLPDLEIAGADESEDADMPRPHTPLDVASRQGRLILRLSAASEAQATELRELRAQLGVRDKSLDEAREMGRQQEKRARQIALQTIHLMDALDWAQLSLAKNGHESLAHEFAAAQRDCLRHLATVGITEIPASGMMDGRLHEGLDAVTTDTVTVPRYHIVEIVRRGYQMGTDILRRAGVTTAA